MAHRIITADFHIHTCLSPCGDWDMSPRALVERCREVGLEMIAVCDHNSAENAGAVMRMGERHQIAVLPGMEICSREEVHLLALFADLETALAMQRIVYDHLEGVNRPDYFGYQVVADEEDEVLGENDRLLIGATTLGVHEIVDRTRELGGIAVAAHIDRPAFGIIGQLGFIPPDLALHAVEVSYRMDPATAHRRIPGIDQFACLSGSDAHNIPDLGRAKTRLRVAACTFQEVVLALRGLDGRGVVL